MCGLENYSNYIKSLIGTISLQMLKEDNQMYPKQTQASLDQPKNWYPNIVILDHLINEIFIFP